MRVRRVIGAITVVLMSIGSLAAAGSDVADAVMNKNAEAVRQLLQKQVDVNAPQVDGATALHWAARWDDLNVADQLIRAGAKVDIANRNGATPLSLASTNGSATMIEKLLAAGANPNTLVNPEGDTVLMLAARTGRLDAVKALVDRGANVNAKETFSSTTALMWAVSEGHSEVAQMLIARGADVNARTKIVPPPPGGTAPPGAKPRDAVGNEAPKPNSSGGLTALMIAARQGDRKSAEVLLAAGANPNVTSGEGSGALQIAIWNGNYDVASLLIDKRADVNQADVNGFTPLFAAVHVRTMDRSDTIPWTVTDDPLPVIENLLKAGADPNARVKATPPNRSSSGGTRPWLKFEGGTAFMRAAFSGDFAVMRMLMVYGADPGITTSDRSTALMAASGLGVIPGYQLDRSLSETLQAIDMLINLGQDVNAINSDGRTALHGAAGRGRNETVQLLVDRGARLDVWDKGSADSKEPLMPIDYAIGVRINGQSAIPQPQTEVFMRKLMADRGIKHTTSECTLRGFTCGDSDPNDFTKLDAEKQEKLKQQQLSDDATKNSNVQGQAKPQQ